MKQSPLRLATGLSAILLAGLAGPAGATTKTECTAVLDGLYNQTLSIQLIGRNADKDEQSLQGKAGEAKAKLAIDKYADAIRKLRDFQNKLTQVSFDPTSAAGYTFSDYLKTSGDGIDCISRIGQ